MVIKFKKLTPFAVTPEYATKGAACFDLHAVDGCTVYPGNQKSIKTGLSVEVPEGHVMLVYPRSGNAAKYKISLTNAVGVIDSDYRGEIVILLDNGGHFSFEVRRGDRIAQAMIVPIPTVSFEEVTELTETERGDRGFGSTGI